LTDVNRGLSSGRIFLNNPKPFPIFSIIELEQGNPPLAILVILDKLLHYLPHYSSRGGIVASALVFMVLLF
jgi:hypothetical protein